MLTSMSDTLSFDSGSDSNSLPADWSLNTRGDIVSLCLSFVIVKTSEVFSVSVCINILLLWGLDVVLFKNSFLRARSSVFNEVVVLDIFFMGVKRRL